MQQNECEIVILKPTSIFLSFLLAQLPHVSLPDLAFMRKDTTAYSLPRQVSDEDTLDEIEDHFEAMFNHEICRWLGPDVHHQIERSFLDFLCCFKFELHTQIVLMEPTIQDAHQLLCVKPKSVLLKWIRSTAEPEDELTRVLNKVNLSQLTKNATVIAKNFNRLSDIKPFMQQYYRPLFKAEMFRMCHDENEWPLVNSFDEFRRYFTVDAHTQLVHLQ